MRGTATGVALVLAACSANRGDDGYVLRVEQQCPSGDGASADWSVSSENYPSHGEVAIFQDDWDELVAAGGGFVELDPGAVAPWTATAMVDWRPFTADQTWHLGECAPHAVSGHTEVEIDGLDGGPVRGSARVWYAEGSAGAPALAVWLVQSTLVPRASWLPTLEAWSSDGSAPDQVRVELYHHPYPPVAGVMPDQSFASGQTADPISGWAIVGLWSDGHSEVLHTDELTAP